MLLRPLTELLVDLGEEFMVAEKSQFLFADLDGAAAILFCC